MISVILSGCFSRYEVTQTVVNENRSVRFLERNDWGLIGFGICGNVYFNYTIKSKYKLIMPNSAGNHKLSEVENIILIAMDPNRGLMPKITIMEISLNQKNIYKSI